MISADSIRVDSTQIYKTVGGRTVYGGGGITPDRFVPIDTTRATRFYIACNRKATQMRFASDIFDHNKASLSAIDNYKDLEAFLDRLDIPTQFLRFAARKDGIKAQPGEWAATKDYLLPQLRALIGRYSKLGDNAFYKLYLPVDTMMQAAIATD
jgi:carboxyl-terminal processing protease